MSRAEIIRDQITFAAQSEGDVETTAVVGDPERLETRFASAVARVRHDQQGLLEERLLGFGLAHAMLLVALASVTLVPIEPRQARPVDHPACI